MPRRREGTALPAAVLLPALLVPTLLGACSPSDIEQRNGNGGTAWFTEEAARRGIDFVHQSGFVERPLLPEITGSGAALADFDGDGDLDAYIVQSGSLYPLGDPRRLPVTGNRLYFNRGDGYFDAAPDANGAADTGYGMGVAAGDFDNDGDVDLYVTNVGANVLLRNNGEGRFEDVTDRAGVGDPRWSTGAGFLDLDADGDLDLYVVNYINWTLAGELKCYVGNALTYCPPANYNAPAADRLYRNNGDGTFTDVSAESGVGLGFGNGFGLVGADFNADGRTDLFVANDMMVDQLWVNRGDWRFVDEAVLWGVAADEHGIAKAGMGVGAADIDRDSDVDVLVVNLEGQTDSFFRNEGSFFRDATAELGLGLSGRFTRFGVALDDFDNDGWLDLYEANGKVSSPSPAAGNVFDEPNVLWRGLPSGRFEETATRGGVAAALSHTSRGVAAGDVDGDGGIDLLVVNRDAPPYLLMNRAAGRGNWIRFRVLLPSGRDAYGATVSALVGADRLYRDVQPDGSYLSYGDPHVHFGLGGETGAGDVAVRWPGETKVERFGDFPGGQTAVLRQGSGRRDEAIVDGGG